jgi:hypothetical protein
LYIVFRTMTAPQTAPRQRYQAWVEEQIEDHKAGMAREELLDLAEEAVQQLFHTPDGQYPLTEILLCDAVDTLLFRRLNLPDFKQWVRTCQNDTADRPELETLPALRAVS